MSEIIRIKPAGANLVRNPDAGMRHVRPEGERVQLSKYWRDRLRDGDVIEVKAETPPETK